MSRDLIDRSGREHLTFAERAQWLRNEALPMPSVDEIAVMVAWIESHPDSETQPAYYLDGESVDEWGTFYCKRHAREEAMRRNHERDIDDAEDLFCNDERKVTFRRWDDGNDRPTECERCGASLDAGGLNRDGIESELGLSETDPMAVSVGLPELLMLNAEIDDADERMRLWWFHAKRARKWALKRTMEIEQTAARVFAETQHGTHPKRPKCAREALNRGYTIARDSGPMPVGTLERAGWLVHEMMQTDVKTP